MNREPGRVVCWLTAEGLSRYQRAILALSCMAFQYHEPFNTMAQATFSPGTRNYD